MDDKIDRLIELRNVRDKANAEIAAILGGGEPRERRPVECSICKKAGRIATGHTARNCPDKSSE